MSAGAHSSSPLVPVRPRRLPVQLPVHGVASWNQRSERERTGARERPGSSPGTRGRVQ